MKNNRKCTTVIAFLSKELARKKCEKDIPFTAPEEKMPKSNSTFEL